MGVPNSIPLKKYEGQNWFQTITLAADKTRSNTEGLYKIAKIAINILMFPIILLAKNTPVSNLKSMFSSYKDICDATLVFPQVNFWTQLGFEKDFRNKTKGLDIAQRTCLTAGSVLKVVHVGQRLSLWNLGRVASFSVGNVPVFSAVTDCIFGLAFILSAVKNGMKWHTSSKTIDKSEKLIDKWKQAETKNIVSDKWADKINDLNTELALPDLKDDVRTKIIEKQGKISSKIALLNGASDAEFAALKERKIEKYEINLKNSKLDLRSAICGIFSDIGKVAAITLNIVAMQIFGWVGLAAQLTITSLSLVAELVGYGKFLSDLQRIERQAAPAA